MTTEARPAMTDKWLTLQAPFDAESVSLLPRATGDKDKRRKESCKECGGYHEFPCIHLSYVGHADITMRLNDVDPEWTWEPMGYDAYGLPALDCNGGLWAWLTILGSRKPAYGDPGLNYKGESKAGTPDGMKEAIGDMLRNGAMRFGVGTALWSKSDKAKAMLIPEDDANGASDPEGKTHGASGAHEPAKASGDPGSHVLTFGKHKDLTIREVDIDDHGYVLWLSRCDDERPGTVNARAFLLEQGQDDPPEPLRNAEGTPVDDDGVPFLEA
jgi:hypothetical protein